mmetsp:Transcript_37230/g.77989  ORF Transcript_37230/g.77989 Transcript_37230/m.77989 type:complete len:475 (-) Transcript_37230:135-1559(-)
MCKSPSPPRQKECLLSRLERLECRLTTPRQIAMERMRCLGMSITTGSNLSSSINQLSCENNNFGRIASNVGGLPSVLVSLLDEAFQSWSSFLETIKAAVSLENKNTPPQQIICNSNETETLQRSINLLSEVTKLDPNLGEEIGRAGTQSICTRLIERINEENHELLSEEDSDALVELQDAVFEIYSPSSSSRSMSFQDDELRRRLPLVYNSYSTNTPSGEMNNDDDDTTIFINQVTKRQSAQADVGFVMWPSAIALSRWLALNPQVISGCNRSVLELGAGCGLVGIVAARIIARQQNCTNKEPTQQVIITDVNELVLDNMTHNIRLNDVTSVASVAKLDFYTQSGKSIAGTWLAGEYDGIAETKQEPVDVILAADIICQPSDAVAASKTIWDALRPDGGVAYVVCATAEHRFGVEIFEGECEKRGLHVTSRNVADMMCNGDDDGEGCLLSKEEMQTAAGYVEGMELTFFEIKKR